MRFLTILSILSSSGAAFKLPFDNNILLPRRDFMGSIIFANSNNHLIQTLHHATDKKNREIKKSTETIDYYAHWSIYGLVPPPIEKTITYNELVEAIKNRTIVYIQITVQHDCIIATTTNFHRWTCILKDSLIDKLLDDTRKPDGSQGVTLIPIDATREKIRNVAQILYFSYIVRFFTLDIPYNYKLLKEAHDMNMTLSEKMRYLSNRTTNINMEDYLNSSLFNKIFKR